MNMQKIRSKNNFIGIFSGQNLQLYQYFIDLYSDFQQQQLSIQNTNLYKKFTLKLVLKQKDKNHKKQHIKQTKQSNHLALNFIIFYQLQMSSKPVNTKNTTSKQDKKTKPKSILPFNKQLLDLQKKIQQVEDKNQRILQQIHKAYNFKKKKIHYQTPGNSQQQDQDNYDQQDNYQEAQEQQYVNNTLPSNNNPKPLRKQHGQYTFQQSLSNNKTYPNSPMVNQFSGIPQQSMNQFKQQTYTANTQKYPNPNQRISQQPYIKPVVLQSRNSNTSVLYQRQTQQQSPPYQEADHQIRYQYQQNGESQQLNNQDGDEDSQFKSNSNYSDIQKRRKITEIAKRRQKDFSDIKSNIQQRRLRTDLSEVNNRKKNQQTRKSFVYQDLENNSLYSEGNVIDRDHYDEDEDIQAEEEAVTSYYLYQRKNPHINRQRLSINPPQQRLIMHSTQQLYSPKNVLTYSKIPVSPVSNPKKYSPLRHSVYVKNPPYIQNQNMSQSQINFLQQMFKNQRQKTINLQKQIQTKQQKIINLKKYKKSFKTFINNSYYVIEEAFDQYVEYFLKNRMYQIEKMVKKNQNKLSALLINLKDIKEERLYHRNLKKHFQNKRNYYSSDQRDRRQDKRTPSTQKNNKHDDLNQNLEQNLSTITTRSRERSISATKRNRGQRDKSVAKKSNQSQLMKKQFTSIADKYESMLKIKNQQIQKIQSELKNVKHTIVTLQQENNKLKQQAAQLSTSNVQSSSTQRRNSGNLRILSRSSSKNDLKKNVNSAVLVEQNQQLSQKIKKYQQQIETISEQKNSISQKYQQIRAQNQKYDNQIKELYKKVSILQNTNKQSSTLAIQKHQSILQQQFQSQKSRLTRNISEIQSKNIQLIKELQNAHYQIRQKDKKISELDSTVFLKQNQIKKLENILTIRNTKLEELNKLLLGTTSNPSNSEGSNYLNDSIASIIEQPQNKSTFIMLHNLQKQLEQEKHQKEIEFLKLKKSYESRIQQLKIQFQEIVLANQKLEDKISEQVDKNLHVQREKVDLLQNVEQLKEQIQQLKKQNTFLMNKVHFYENQRQTNRGSFGITETKKSKKQQNNSPFNNSGSQRHQNILEVHDFDEFPDEQNSIDKHNISKSIQSWKPESGQIQLLQDSSSYTATFITKRSQQKQPHHNSSPLKKLASLGQSAKQNFFSLKDQNIQLCQKIAKLQKQNIFLRQSQKQQSQKIQSLKNQLSAFNIKYEELQNNNQQLLKMVEQLEKQKCDILASLKQTQGKTPFDWKQVEKNIEPVDLKGSGIYGAWNFAQKDDILLDKSAAQFGIRDSIVSNVNMFTHSNRPSRQQTQKKVQQLTQKLAQTQLLLDNKQKMTQQVIKGFTKKFDSLNTQIEQQAKVIQKYIHENSKLRKQKQKLQDQIEKTKKQNDELSVKLKQMHEYSEVNQYKEHLVEVGENYNDNRILEQQQENQEQQEEGNFQMLQQRIEAFDFNINSKQKNQNNYPQDDQQNYPNVNSSIKIQKPLLIQHENNNQQQPHIDAVTFQPLLEQQMNVQQFDDNAEYNSTKIQMLQTQIKQQQQTIDQLQKCLKQTLIKVKTKQQEKISLVQQLRRKNYQLEELKDLLELKQAGRNNQLNLSKSVSHHPVNILDRSSLQKSQRPRFNSIASFKYSQSNQGHKQRRSSYEGDQINFVLEDANTSHNNNMSLNMMLQQSHLSGMYSQNMSMIFQKQQNFLQQIKKAKNKRKQEGKLLKSTFEYIKKLRLALNDKNKRIKILQNRLQQLKDNCWLWKKNGQPNISAQKPMNAEIGNNEYNQNNGYIKQATEFIANNDDSGIQGDYMNHNDSFSMEEKNKLVDSRLFECNSEDLNKKKPHRHNHYKKLQFDTKLITQQNKILTKQIEILQQQLIKIEEQQNGLMAVKQIYKQQIRVLTRQNQQLTKSYQQQMSKLQQKFQTSESIHNFEAIKQLFKKIIDNIGVMLHPSTFSIDLGKKKQISQMKEEKRKQAEQCIKVLCSILDYDDLIKNQLCTKLSNA